MGGGHLMWDTVDDKEKRAIERALNIYLLGGGLYKRIEKEKIRL
jgi:hypothetical protein